MIRLRCFLFARLVRERRDRALNPLESDFLRRHVLDCSECRARMHISDMCLDALSGARIEPHAEPPPLRLGVPRSSVLTLPELPFVLAGGTLLAFLTLLLSHRH